MSKEDMAMQDIRELFRLMEKRVRGELRQADRELLERNVAQWQKSIEFIREDIENNKICKCEKCQEKIRVPKHKMAVISCPKCGYKFLVYEENGEDEK